MQVDLVSEEGLNSTERALSSINADAAVLRCQRCDIDLAFILNRGVFDPQRASHTAQSLPLGMLLRATMHPNWL